jgi:hypothetical protein
MESSYVVLGEAAGIAASHVVTSGGTVHKVNVDAIRADMKTSGVITEWDGTGYGPHSRRHWSAGAVYWLTNPEEYRKPIRLDPDWEDYDPATAGFGPVPVQAFPSVEDWNQKKPGYEWLFPFIDENVDGRISLEEHRAFQDYKKTHPDWASTLKPEE